VFALVTALQATSDRPSGWVPDELALRAPPQVADQGKRFGRVGSFGRVSNELSEM